MNDIPSGEEQEARNNLVLSYLSVRRALGMLGFSLPVLLAAAGLLSGDGIQPSISEFYFTSAGDILVGVLSAIGVFLWAYRGFERRPDEFFSDYVISRLAVVGAVGVALIPTRGPMDSNPLPMMHRLLGVDLSQKLHFASATLFFLCLAVFCLVLFRRRDPAKPITPAKRAQNRIYLVCGWIILTMILALGVFGWWYSGLPPERQTEVDRLDAVFYLESIAVFAFSVSWLTKGKTLAPLERLVLRFG